MPNSCSQNTASFSNFSCVAWRCGLYIWGFYTESETKYSKKEVKKCTMGRMWEERNKEIDAMTHYEALKRFREKIWDAKGGNTPTTVSQEWVIWLNDKVPAGQRERERERGGGGRRWILNRAAKKATVSPLRSQPFHLAAHWRLHKPLIVCEITPL